MLKKAIVFFGNTSIINGDIDRYAIRLYKFTYSNYFKSAVSDNKIRKFEYENITTMKRISAITLAEFILTSYPNRKITPMKLQKLAYYAKIWTLVANRQCIDAQFERWQFGPVNREIYRKYKPYSREDIPTPVDLQTRVQGEDAEFLKFILNNYVDHSAVALSAMTHKEKPWVETPPDAVISDDAMREYYSKHSFARNFQGKSWNEGEFFVLKTNSWHSFTMDMTDDEARAYESYPSYTEYLRRTKIANKEFDKFLEELF